MLTNFIIYEDNLDMQDTYKMVINSLFSTNNEKPNIYIFNKYRVGLEKEMNAIKGKNIYILDIEVPGKSGLDLARMIRSNGDWLSPLIVITSYEHLKNTGFTSKVLMLDFISKRNNMKKYLRESLLVAYNIIHSNDAFTFQYNGELYHISFDEILYFEKDLNDNYTFLVTKNELYKIKDSIVNIYRQLEYNINFMRIHRSCIVNLDNIDKMDTSTNTIYFGNKQTCLLAREKRSDLIHILKSYKIID